MTNTLLGYDSAGRLASLYHGMEGTSADVATSFARNPAGQITSEGFDNNAYAWPGHVDIARNYAVNGLNQYTGAGQEAFTYDANGNLTSATAPGPDGNWRTVTYLYDHENRLVKVTTPRTGGGEPYVTEMRYDPLGRLYRIDDSERGRTTFLHDGDALVAEYGAGGVLLRRYIHGADVGADDPLVWYEGAGVTDAGRRFLRRDARGSIVAVSDHLGNPIAINAYDEYGIPEQTGMATGATDNLGRFQYTGQLWIPEVGLYYYKARWYSPTLGRFLQTDPIGYEDQFNLYVYVGNDPVNGVDPTGMDACYGTSQCGTKQLTAEDKAVQQAILEGTVFVAAAGLDIMNTPVSPGPDFIIVVTGTREVAKRPGWFRRFVNWVTGKKCCFVAGTLVDTEDGLRPIEEVAIGDNVWARDEETGETELKAVTDLIRLHERVIWEVALTGPEGETEQFETTDDHPWWVAGQGWKATGELKAGMAVVTRDGRGMLVASVAETGRTDATYNLTVADFETYFVGEQRVLVHNCPTGSYEHTFSSRKTYDGKGDPGRAARTGREIARDNNDPLVSTEHRTATSDRESFIQESRSLDRNGGPGSDRNYNKIESPGKRMRREDGEID